MTRENEMILGIPDGNSSKETLKLLDLADFRFKVLVDGCPKEYFSSAYSDLMGSRRYWAKTACSTMEGTYLLWNETADPKILVNINRPQNLTGCVSRGDVDLAIVGRDLYLEDVSSREGIVLLIPKLPIVESQLVAAIPQNGEKAEDTEKPEFPVQDYIKRVLAGGGTLSIFTEYPSAASKWIMEQTTYKLNFGTAMPKIEMRCGSMGENSRVVIRQSFGKTEGFFEMAERASQRGEGYLIVDITVSGDTQRKNRGGAFMSITNLYGCLIANRQLLEEGNKNKIEKLRELTSALKDAARKMEEQKLKLAR